MVDSQFSGHSCEGEGTRNATVWQASPTCCCHHGNTCHHFLVVLVDLVCTRSHQHTRSENSTCRSKCPVLSRPSAGVMNLTEVCKVTWNKFKQHPASFSPPSLPPTVTWFVELTCCSDELDSWCICVRILNFLLCPSPFPCLLHRGLLLVRSLQVSGNSLCHWHTLHGEGAEPNTSDRTQYTLAHTHREEVCVVCVYVCVCVCVCVSEWEEWPRPPVCPFLAWLASRPPTSNSPSLPPWADPRWTGNVSPPVHSWTCQQHWTPAHQSTHTISHRAQVTRSTDVTHWHMHAWAHTHTPIGIKRWVSPCVAGSGVGTEG